MKLATFGNENAATAGATREIAIGFQANAVAFYAQISGLAEDKVGYPMRELNTNAWDATRARYGADVPDDRRPELTLPTSLTPIFRVRDYGFGMNHELMETVYGQMYASTKRESSDEVGGWGIGRFSSFGYLIGREGAASYRVTSIADEADGRRLKTIWTVSINRNGTPVLRELMSMETTEETGLEVSFDVRREDIQTFHNRARTILWSFDPRPRITPEFEWPENEVLASGEGWTYYGGSTSPFGSGPRLPFHGPQVRMGCVTYPIDLNQIEGARGLLDANEPVLFDAGIGTLSVTLSREGLAYDERTVATLSTLISTFASAVADTVQERVTAATTYFEACTVFEQEARRLGNRTARLRPLIRWQGHAMRESIQNSEVCKFMHLNEGWRTFDKFSNQPARPAYLKGAQVVVEHRPYYSMERFDAAGLVGKHLLWVRVKKDQLDEALAMLGNPEYTVLDDTKVDAAPREKTRKMIRNRRTLVVRRHGLHRMTQEIDLAAGGLYVVEHKGEPLNYYRRRRADPTYQVFADGTAVEWGDLDRAVKNCFDLELLELDTPILLKADSDELGDNWIPLGKKVERRLKRKVNVRHLSGLNNKTTYNMDRTLRIIAEHVSFEGGPADLRQFDLDLTALFQRLSGNETVTQPTDLAISALKALGRPFEVPEFECPIEAIGKRWDDLRKKYPLLHYVIPSSGYNWDRQEKSGQLEYYLQLLSYAPAVEEPATAAETDQLEDDDVLAEAA
jgi:hypothetical protein